MSIGDQVKREAAEYIEGRNSSGETTDGLPIIVLQQGVTKLRLYYDNKSNRLIRTFKVHMLNGSTFWCSGKTCVFCNKIEELKKSKGWNPDFKVLPMERDIAYGVIYGADWTSEYLVYEKPVIISMQWRVKRAIMEYFATLETSLLDSWLSSNSENYVLSVSWFKGKKGSANASLDVSQKKVMPDLPTDAAPLTDVWTTETIIDPSADEDAAKALRFLEEKATMYGSLKKGEDLRKPSTSPSTPKEEPPITPTEQQQEVHAIPPESDGLTLLKNRGCPDFGHHKGTGNTDCILCPVEKECIAYTKKLNSQDLEDDIPF